MYAPQSVIGFLIGLGIVFGAIECFLGYKIFKILLAIIGFLLGGTLAAAGGFAISREAGAAILFGILGGIVGAALLYFLYFIGVFLIGGLLGFLLGAILYLSVGSTPEPAVLLVLAIIGGVLALIFQKFMIILSTSFGGSMAVVIGVSYFAGLIDPANIIRSLRSAGNFLYAILLSWVALGIVGVLVQYRTTRSPKGMIQPMLTPQK